MLPTIDHAQLPPNCRVLVIPEEQQMPSELFSDFPEVLTAQQVSKALSICDKQVRSLAMQGQLKGFRVGKNHRFTKQAVIDFIEQGGTHGQIKP